MFLVTTGFGADMPLEINASAKGSFHMAYTGLYGGGAKAGIEYGIRTKKLKILFVTLSIPLPYCGTYADAWRINETAHYISGNLALNADVSVTPRIHGSVGLNISGVVGADLGAEFGLKHKLAANLVNTTLSGTATVYSIAGVYVEHYAGIPVPFIGRVGFSKRFNILNQNTVLKTWNVAFQSVF